MPFTDWSNAITNNVNILTNIANTMAPVQQLVSGAAYLIGMSFAFKAIYSLKVYGEARTMMSNSASLKDPLIHLIVAGILIYLPSGFQMMLNTTFGPNSSLLSYSGAGNQTLSSMFGQNSSAGLALTLIIRTIGLIAFVRGWVLIAKSASQGQPPGGTGKGLTHVFGGILAMNCIGTLDIINNTLYGNS
jgi:intracellular multiplication protein IcmC